MQPFFQRSTGESLPHTQPDPKNIKYKIKNKNKYFA
jgi:hypothetical protein